MYARVNKLDYFYTECIYAPNAYRGYSRLGYHVGYIKSFVSEHL